MRIDFDVKKTYSHGTLTVRLCEEVEDEEDVLERMLYFLCQPRQSREKDIDRQHNHDQHDDVRDSLETFTYIIVFYSNIHKYYKNMLKLHHLILLFERHRRTLMITS